MYQHAARYQRTSEKPTLFYVLIFLLILQSVAVDTTDIDLLIMSEPNRNDFC